MKKNLIIHRVESRTPEWHEARKTHGIGASEAAACLTPSLHEYTSGIRVFYEKIGMVPHQTTNNEFIHWGIADEEKIAEAWEFWDGKLDENKNPNYINNFAAGNRIRRCRRVNGIIQNPKFPWIYMSPDRLINKGMPTLDDNLELNGPPLEFEAPLEVKTISKFSSNKWKIKIPVYYLVQVTVQMIVMEVDYCEMAIREDGNKLRVERIPFMPELANQILEQTRDFWERVKMGKTLYAQMLMESDRKKQELILAEIHKLEPPNDGSEDFSQFMSDTFLQQVEQITGDNSDLDNAFKSKLMNAVIKQAEKKKLYYDNNLRLKFNHETAGRIELGDAGYLKYFKKEGGKNFQIYNGLKTEIDEELIDKIIQEHIVNIF